MAARKTEVQGGQKHCLRTKVVIPGRQVAFSCLFFPLLLFLFPSPPPSPSPSRGRSSLARLGPAGPSLVRGGSPRVEQEEKQHDEDPLCVEGFKNEER